MQTIIRIVLPGTLFLFLSFNVYAERFGLGVDLNQGNSTVYLPIRFNEHWSIEPYFSQADISPRTSRSIDNDYRSYTFGVGLFHHNAINDKANHYYGIRAERGRSHTQSQWENRDSMDNIVYDSYTQKSICNTVIPTIGFEYYLTKSFALAAEAGYAIRKIKDRQQSVSHSIDDNNNDWTEYDSNTMKQSSSGTTTKIIARYMFN